MSAILNSMGWEAVSVFSAAVGNYLTESVCPLILPSAICTPAASVTRIALEGLSIFISGSRTLTGFGAMLEGVRGIRRSFRAMVRPPRGVLHGRRDAQGEVRLYRRRQPLSERAYSFGRSLPANFATIAGGFFLAQEGFTLPERVRSLGLRVAALRQTFYSSARDIANAALSLFR